jgi:F-type H+-transporting ATPase subunit a
MYHWTWFHLIPGISDGSAVPALGADAAHIAHVFPTAWFVVGLLSIFALIANRGLAAARARGGTLQYVPADTLSVRNLFEIFTEGMINLIESVLGSRKMALAYLPLMGTLFIYILVSNLLGVVPGFLPPTSDISNNAAMALVVFFTFNIVGVYTNGLGYFKHMMGPMLALAWLIFPLEIIGILIRPVSLSIRLFGNINGDHMVFGVFSDLVPLIVPGLFLALGMFVSFIQAFVFTLLSVVYVALAVGHADEHH